MRLGLLGFPVEHSLSPSLYKEFLGLRLTSYELFSYPTAGEIPPLSFFSNSLDGLNITSPYKAHFFDDIEIPSVLVKSIGAVNTIAFKEGKAVGTNTDLLAVVEILKDYKAQFPSLHLVLLGDGAMARVTKVVAENLGLPLSQFSRKVTPLLAELDLTTFHKTGTQTLIINSCSRDFIFKGKLTGEEIFWDYNYSFLPHQNTLPSRLKIYQDGRSMLELQAREAIKFWDEVNSKYNS